MKGTIRRHCPWRFVHELIGIGALLAGVYAAEVPPTIGAEPTSARPSTAPADVAQQATELQQKYMVKRTSRTRIGATFPAMSSDPANERPIDQKEFERLQQRQRERWLARQQQQEETRWPRYLQWETWVMPVVTGVVAVVLGLAWRRSKRARSAEGESAAGVRQGEKPNEQSTHDDRQR
jgi:hypothetical protein